MALSLLELIIIIQCIDYINILMVCNQIFLKQLKLKKPDYFLEAVGNTTAETIGYVIAKSDDIMAREKPHALLLLGDT